MRHFTVLLTITLFITGSCVKCYIGVEQDGERWKACDLQRGFRTCYTKFDPFGEVIARGCSSKEKMFHEHCETHEMDEVVEKFCYCSFNWCNASLNIKAVSFPSSVVLLFIHLLFTNHCLS
eukprot:TRINITY_DN15683_c0_g1_i1.p1 TRINITY_DN15683_c0_g1~~TRINITY_DN15683_c0_g1_i1.p1  ORF type:complete len:121 (+),score=25.29 TRINITY_DN15683_c0_g1_i1:191-553(+)